MEGKPDGSADAAGTAAPDQNYRLKLPCPPQVGRPMFTS
jgi:hypothetical protein